MTKDDPIITPTTDLFIASLWSAPKNEPLLLSLLNAVMTNIGHPKIVEAKVLNPFNIQEYPTDKQIRLDVRVVDELKAMYNVEVQTDSHTSFFDRMLYYWKGLTNCIRWRIRFILYWTMRGTIIVMRFGTG